MSTVLFDSIARIAKHESNSRAIAGVGVVTDTHASSGPDNDYAVSVKMRDTGLVLKNVPVASGVLGTVAMPDAGDLVVLVFMDGDHHAPVIVGRLHHPDRNPPAQEAEQLIMSFPAGEEEAATHLSVSRNSEANVHLNLGEDFNLDLTPETATLTIGEMTLEITSKSGGRAELAAAGSTIVMKQDGDINVSSAAKLLLEGNEVEIKGQSKVVIQGAEVNVN